MLREGKGMGNLRLVIPGIPGIPGNQIKSKVKFNILFIFMPWPAIHKTANNDSISRLNSRSKLPFPGNGKGNYKMPREGKGLEIWGLYSRESRETGISAHPCSEPVSYKQSSVQKMLVHLKSLLPTLAIIPVQSLLYVLLNLGVEPCPVLTRYNCRLYGLFTLYVIACMLLSVLLMIK